MQQTLNLIIFGPQGSGKGTQAKLLGEKFGILHVSTGQLFREAISAGSALGEEAKKYLDAGNLVPDDVTIGLVKEVLSSPSATTGFVLDGFPRTLPQYESLESFLSLDLKVDFMAVFLELSEEESVRRLATRFTCEQCGAIYIGNNRPCQKCGGKLIQRADETPEAIKKRLEIFNTQTLPIIAKLDSEGRLVRVNGAQSIEEVHEEILDKLRLSS